MVTIERIHKIHEKALQIDREYNPHDYAPGYRYSAILELMLEYKVGNSKTVFMNAAIALQEIAAQHPFVNGNKRTAFLTAKMILAEEGYNLVASTADTVKFVISVATPEKEVSLEQIEAWLKNNSRKDFNCALDQ
jgi:death on curing protein